MAVLGGTLEGIAEDAGAAEEASDRMLRGRWLSVMTEVVSAIAVEGDALCAGKNQDCRMEGEVVRPPAPWFCRIRTL